MRIGNRTKLILLVAFLAAMWLCSCGIVRKTTTAAPGNSNKIPMGE